MKNITLIAIAAFILSGCASAYISPETKNLPTDKVAIIKVKNSGAAYPNWSSSIHRVVHNNKTILPDENSSGPYDNLRLAPGVYKVYMGCKLGLQITRDNVHVELEVDAKAGYTYVLDCRYADGTTDYVTVYIENSYKTPAQP